jgi:hypothetical protein
LQMHLTTSKRITLIRTTGRKSWRSRERPQFKTSSQMTMSIHFDRVECFFYKKMRTTKLSAFFYKKSGAEQKSGCFE